MSISSTRTFDLTRSQIIDAALADVGAVGPGRSTTDQNIRTDANNRLNALVEELSKEDIWIWRRIRRTATLVAGTATFSPAADVWGIDGDMDLLPTGETTRFPVTKILIADYMQLPDRTSRARPTLYAVEETIGSSGVALVVSLYRTPDAADTVEYIAYLKAATFTTDAVTGDFPASAIRMLRYGLDLDLSSAHRVPEGRRTFFQGQFEQGKALLIASNTENVAGRFIPRSY